MKNTQKTSRREFVKTSLAFGGLATLSSTQLIGQVSPAKKSGKKIKALLVTGGGYHDYKKQKGITLNTLNSGTQFDIDWTVFFPHHKDDAAVIEYFENPNWAEGFDIVVYNLCFANTGDASLVENIIKPHRAGLPAVVMHCALHCFRPDPAAHLTWHQFCGAQSPKHGPKHPFEVELLAPNHEALEGMGNWTTTKGELYYVPQVFPTATPLAQSMARDLKEMQTNIWVNEFGENKTRVFGTTIGHYNVTMEQQQYRNMLSRGFVWALNEPVAANIV